MWDTGCTGQAVPITPQLLFCAIQRPCAGIHGEMQGHKLPCLSEPCLQYRADLKRIVEGVCRKSQTRLFWKKQAKRERERENLLANSNPFFLMMNSAPIREQTSH